MQDCVKQSCVSGVSVVSVVAVVSVVKTDVGGVNVGVSDVDSPESSSLELLFTATTIRDTSKAMATTIVSPQTILRTFSSFVL